MATDSTLTNGIDSPSAASPKSLASDDSSYQLEFSASDEELHATASETSGDSIKSVQSDVAPYKIEELWIYPIKSVAGIRVDKAKVTPTGLQCDRQWMFVDDDGRAITSVEERLISILRTRFLNNGQEIELRRASVSENVPILILPAFPKWRFHESELKIIPIEIGGTYGTAYDFISLDHPLKRAIMKFCKGIFFWKSSPCPRLVFQAEARHCRTYLVPGCRTTNFADTYPIQIASLQSLRYLNAHMAKQRAKALKLQGKKGIVKHKTQILDDEADLSMFRPNIVLSGGTPWDEGNWAKVRIGDSLTLEVLDGAAQKDRDSTIWRTLAALEGAEEHDEEVEDPTFGSLASALLATGDSPSITVGDSLEVLATSDLPFADFPASENRCPAQ